MRVRPTGGIFWRLDSNGNLTAYDTSGNVISKFIGGKLSSQGNNGTIVTNSVSFTTSSTTDVYLGLSSQITPQVSTNVLVMTNMSGSNNTAGHSVVCNVRRNTGTNNPAGGTSASGIVVVGMNATSTVNSNLSVCTVDTEVTIGQAYTYSLCISVQVGTDIGSFGFSTHLQSEILSVREI